jgi:hypothetical protein
MSGSQYREKTNRHLEYSDYTEHQALNDVASDAFGVVLSLAFMVSFCLLLLQLIF